MTKPRPLIVHFEFDQVEIFAGHIPPLKLHILFYGNRLATWHGSPDITHNFMTSIMAATRAILNLIKLNFLGHFSPETTHFVS